MNSRKIIIDLIDKQLINGEDAFTLINDIIQSELLESWKALNNKENKDLVNDFIKEKPWNGSSGITWTYTGDGTYSLANVASTNCVTGSSVKSN